MRRSLEAYAAAVRALPERLSFFRRSLDVGRTNHTSHLCPFGSTKFRKLILLLRLLVLRNLFARQLPNQANGATNFQKNSCIRVSDSISVFTPKWETFAPLSNNTK